MLHAAEARERVAAALVLCQTKLWRIVKVITGKGIHSRVAGESPVRGAVEELLKSSRGLVQSYSDQPGSFIVKLRVL